MFVLVDNCLLYDAIHGFSVYLKTGFNLADMNRFRNHTGIIITFKLKRYFQQNVPNDLHD